MDDRIALYLGTESAVLQKAVTAHKDYISAETLAVQWVTQPLGEGAHRATAKIEGEALTIEMRKAA
jgi:hypothetical protein